MNLKQKENGGGFNLNIVVAELREIKGTLERERGKDGRRERVNETVKERRRRDPAVMTWTLL